MDYFVKNITEIKEYTDLDSNIDDKSIRNNIRLVYDKYLYNMCGVEEYLTKYNDNTHVWTDDELDILSIIKNIMYQGIVYETTLNTSLPTTNKGLQRKDGEHSDSVDYATLGAKRKNIFNNLSFYQKLLHDKMAKLNKCSCLPKQNNKNIFFI